MQKTNFRFVGLVIIALVTFVYDVSAQVPNIINGGVINGKAKTLKKPAYPPAAKAVGAAGAVVIEVVIDENGDVISASAVSGHPLLRAAAEQAARESKFAPTMLSGQPVKVSGKIVYNFVAPETAVSWINSGYELSKADASNNYGEGFNASSVAYRIPPEWTEESAKANAVAQKQRYETTQKRIAEAVKNPSTEVETMTLPKGMIIKKDNSADFANVNEAQTVRELIPLLKNRLLNDPVRGWYFNLGVALGKTDAQMNDVNAFRQNIAELRQIQAIAPSQISSGVATELQNVITLGEKGDLTVAENEQLRKSLLQLSKF